MAYLAPLILKQEPKLKRQVCCALAQIAKHSVDMAEVVVEAEVFPKILTCLKFPDELVRKHAATVVREVSSPFCVDIHIHQCPLPSYATADFGCQDGCLFPLRSGIGETKGW